MNFQPGTTATPAEVALSSAEPGCTLIDVETRLKETILRLETLARTTAILLAAARLAPGTKPPPPPPPSHRRIFSRLLPPSRHDGYGMDRLFGYYPGADRKLRSWACCVERAAPATT